MKYDKVVYLRYFPLTSKIASDFYMFEVQKNGLEVEYWDLTALYFKNSFVVEDSSDLVLTRKFLKFSEFELVIKSQSNLSRILFISIVSFEGRVLKLYKILTKYDCNLGVFGRNMFPTPSIRKNLFSVIVNLTFSKILNYLQSKIALQLISVGKIKKYDVVFLAGSCGWQGIGRIAKANLDGVHQIKVNSDDYDKFLLLQSSIINQTDKHILFLDEYLPFHPDTVLFNMKNIKAEDYYPELNRYFDKVEKKFGLPVVIAAHPKAIKYKTENFFDGRKVIFNQTPQLTRDSLFVIAHDSTSINFPIAFCKKLHFITSTNIKKSIGIVHRNVIHMSDFLGCNHQYIDNLDEKINLIDILPVERYKMFKYNFQTSLETENKLTSEIFIDYLVIP